jgi:hypothetical protein
MITRLSILHLLVVFALCALSTESGATNDFSPSEAMEDFIPIPPTEKIQGTISTISNQLVTSIPNSFIDSTSQTANLTDLYFPPLPLIMQTEVIVEEENLVLK